MHNLEENRSFVKPPGEITEILFADGKILIKNRIMLIYGKTEKTL